LVLNETAPLPWNWVRLVVSVGSFEFRPNLSGLL
jgi:hypothetical protein